ncbi:MAG: GHKL domain-containing protein [Oscillospiraceae bacterium]
MYNPNVWWHVLQFLAFMAPVGYLGYRVFENHLRFKKPWFWVILSLYCVMTSTIIALTLTEVSPFRTFGTFGMLCIIILSLSAIKLLVKKSTYSLLFVLFVLLNLQYNTFLLSDALIDFGLIPHFVEYENGNLLLISLIFTALLFPVVRYLLVKQFKRIEDENFLPGRIKLLFCMPMGFFLVVLTLFPINPDAFATKENLFPLIVITICEFASYFAALQAIIASNVAAKESEALIMANTQISLWTEQYTNLQSQVEADSRIRHDWRHHIISVLGFVNNRDMDGLNDYLAVYKEKYVMTEEASICDINSVDMLFQYYKRRAKERSIKLTISPVILGHSHIFAPDFTIIFGNLLENAIEACERMEVGEKYINLKIRADDGHLIAIICENSFDGVVNRRENKILSRKEKGGIGLSSIESITQKYDGSMKVKVDGNVFKIYIALK